MTIDCASAEDRDALLEMHIDEGTAHTLDNLGKHLGKVTSKDGTTIAYDRIGHGPAVILVDGALSYRGAGQSKQLAELLAPDFTVFTFDRRGRGRVGTSGRTRWSARSRTSPRS